MLSARRTFVCAALALTLAPVAAEAASPLRPRIARCTPVRLGDSQGGKGGTPAARRVGLDFGLFTEPADDGDPAGALTATTRLEVCWVRAAGAGNLPDGACPAEPKSDGTPGDDEWLVFDDTDKPLDRPFGKFIKTKADLESWIRASGEKGALPEQLIWLPVDWADATNAGTLFFLRVNGEAVDFQQLASEPALQQGGFCPIVELMAQAEDAAGGKFDFFGTPATLADPFGGALGDICKKGNKSGAFDSNACADLASAQFVAERLLAIGNWQKTVAMAQMTTPLDPPVWANGQCGGGLCPAQVLSYTSNGAAHGDLAGFHLWAATGIANPLDKAAGGTLRTTSHEYWHSLQLAWDRAKQSLIHGQLWTEPFSESSPSSLESNLCFFNYPGGVPPGKCVSARRLGYNPDIAPWQHWFDAPHLNLLEFHYTGSLFWRYAMEQFALPLDPASPAHPSGKTSLFPNPGGGVPLADRRSDEGADLLGLTIEAFLADPEAPSLDGIDQALRDSLGRGLEALMLDLDTAALLKDYPDADPRWHLEWVGNYEAGAADHFACAAFAAGACPYAAPNPPLAEVKQAGKFPVQPDLVSPAPVSDFLHRAHRELDVYEPCTACTAPALVPFGTDRVEASTQERYLPPFGAMYLSAAPEPGISSLRIRLSPKKGTKPRFRIFLVDASDQPKLYGSCAVDADGAGADDTERCQPNLNGEIDEVVPIDPGVAEILVVASAGRSEGRFTWKIGADKPTVEILDPTAGHPAPVGHPGPSDATRPFLAQLAVVDQDGGPLSGLDPAAVHLSVPGCAPTSPAAPACELANGTDFSVSEVGAGLYWAIGRIPAGFYPASGSRLDLAVTVDGLSPQPIEDLAPQSLAVEAAPEVVTQVVLDRSGSMGEVGGAKWEAAKVATQLVLDAIPDGERFGLVAFNQDAATPYALTVLDAAERSQVQQVLANLSPGGFTSVGDGLLEAQSNLIAAGFDLPDPAQPQLVLQTILLSDGISNSGYIPRRYYLWEPNAGAIDGSTLPEGATDGDPSDNQPWKTGATGKLSWPERKKANALVPSVSAVAIGEDAEPAELMSLAEICGGAFSYVEPVTESAQFLKASIEMSDAFRQAMNRATGHERSFAGRAPSLEELPSLEVEPKASELLVSVAAGFGGAETLRLVGPDGAKHTPAATSGTSAVFRVAAPSAGTWRFERHEFPVIKRLESAGAPAPANATVGGEPRVFVESALRSPVGLIARADVATVGRAGALPEEGYESRRWAGRPILIRAAVVAGRPVAGIELRASIQPPSGPVAVVALADDGQHADGRAGDGFYGYVLQATPQPGVYRIRIEATGLAPGGFPFRRERTLAVSLHAGPDTDGDGLPDVWEEEAGTDLGRPDAGDDPDGDGRSNADELALGTEPRVSDTDGGGEADGSELAAGRDPLAPADDATRPFAPTWRPGFGRGLLRLPAPAGTAIEVECGPERDGPFEPVATAPFGDGDRSVDLPDSEAACCRTRTIESSAVSAWSAPRCFIPGHDPYPPQLSLEPATGRAWSPSRRVRVRLVVSDVPERNEGGLAEDPEAVATGVREMRVATRGDFAGAAWRPFEQEAEVVLEGENGGSVWAQVRDGAGNLSAPASLPFALAARTPLDRAIGLEERALERMRAGAWREARQAVRESRSALRESLETVRARVENAGGASDANDRKLLRDLRKVACRKLWARLLAHRTFGQCAIRKLERALVLERAIADEALRYQLPL